MAPIYIISVICTIVIIVVTVALQNSDSKRKNCGLHNDGIRCVPDFDVQKNGTLYMVELEHVVLYDTDRTNIAYNANVCSFWFNKFVRASYSDSFKTNKLVVISQNEKNLDAIKSNIVNCGGFDKTGWDPEKFKDVVNTAYDEQKILHHDITQYDISGGIVKDFNNVTKKNVTNVMFLGFDTYQYQKCNTSDRTIFGYTHNKIIHELFHVLYSRFSDDKKNKITQLHTKSKHKWGYLRTWYEWFAVLGTIYIRMSENWIVRAWGQEEGKLLSAVMIEKDEPELVAIFKDMFHDKNVQEFFCNMIPRECSDMLPYCRNERTDLRYKSTCNIQESEFVCCPYENRVDNAWSYETHTCFKESGCKEGRCKPCDVYVGDGECPDHPNQAQVIHEGSTIPSMCVAQCKRNIPTKDIILKGKDDAPWGTWVNYYRMNNIDDNNNIVSRKVNAKV